MAFRSLDLKGLAADDTWLYSGVKLHPRLYLSPLCAGHCGYRLANHPSACMRVFTHDFIIPQMGWVGGKMRALLSIEGTWAACGPLLDSWQVDRSPTRERQFHGPHCLHWLLLWSQESRARDSRKPPAWSRSSWAEEVIMLHRHHNRLHHHPHHHH